MDVENIVTEDNVDPSCVRQSVSVFPLVPEENHVNAVFAEQDEIPPAPVFMENPLTQTASVPPPPPAPGPLPPPPPMPRSPVFNDMMPPTARNQPPSFLDQVKDGVKLRKAEPVEVKAVDTRSDLLSQIRAGRALKKVQQNDNGEKKRASGIVGTFQDVMRDRRFAMESESEDEDDSDDDFSWDE